MKKYIWGILLGVFFLLLITFPVVAQTTIQSEPLRIRDRIQTQLEKTRPSTPSILRPQQKEQTRERIQKRIATIEGRLKERKANIIRNFFNRLVKRLEAAIARLEKLIARIEARLDKIEAANEDINTTKIRKDVNQAKEKLISARATLGQAKDKFENLPPSDTPKEVFAEARDLIQEVKKQLIEVHRILVKIIGDIKGLRVGTTSTPSATGE